MRVGNVFAVIEVEADLCTRPLRKRGNNRSNILERNKVLMPFSMLDDNRVTGLLSHLDCGSNGLEARRIHGGNRHVVLLGYRTDISQSNEHLSSFLRHRSTSRALTTDNEMRSNLELVLEQLP